MKKRSWWIYILIFIVSQLAAVGITMGATLIQGREAVSSETVAIGALCTANVLAILLWLLLHPKDLTWQRTMSGIRSPKGMRTKLAFGLALPVIMLVNLIQEAFFPDIPDLVGDELMKTIIFNPAGLLTVALIGPVCEELLFRGGVQHCIQQRYASQGPGVAIGLSAVLFCAIHMNPAQMPAAFILGIVLGFAYWWTDSLIAPVCIHVFNNSFACALGMISPDDNFIQFLGGTQGAVITAVVCVFWLYLMVYLIRREMRKSTEIG